MTTDVLVTLALAVVASRLVASLGVRLALSRFRRVPPEAHWTERARAAATARSLAGIAIVAAGLPPAFALVGTGLSGAWVAVLAVLAMLLGIRGTRAPLDDALGMGGARRGGGLAAVLVLYAAVYLTLLVAGIVAELEDTTSAFLVWLLGGLCLAGWTRGGAFVALDALGAALPPPARLRDAVARAAEKVGMPPPPTRVLPMRIANAWAFPMAGQLAFTERAIESLDDASLEAVVLHELGHLREPPSVVFFRALRVLLVYVLALAGLVWRLAPFGTFVLVMAVLVLALLARRLSVRFEEAADRVAHAHADEGTYAHALERLHEVNLAPAVVRGGGTHPSLYDRLVAAGASPSYPRPAPPETARAARLVVMLVAIALGLALNVGRAWVGG